MSEPEPYNNPIWDKYQKALAEIHRLTQENAEFRENHDWCCGCGHWNGCNLPFCAICGRRPCEALEVK